MAGAGRRGRGWQALPGVRADHQGGDAQAEIGADGVAQLLRFLDTVAGEEAAGEKDLPWDSPALRALRWWDAEDRP
jgi:hypothetical protein